VSPAFGFLSSALNELATSPANVTNAKPVYCRLVNIPAHLAVEMP